MAPLNADEIAWVRKIQLSLGGVKTCSSCGATKFCGEFRDWGVRVCNGCAEKPAAQANRAVVSPELEDWWANLKRRVGVGPVA